jgi:hypothetical protein
MDTTSHETIFNLVDEIISAPDFNKGNIEEISGLRFVVATKQNSEGHLIYESGPSARYSFIPYGLFYERQSQESISFVNQLQHVHIGLNKELPNFTPLKVSDVLKQYGDSYTFNTPASSNYLWGYRSFYSYTGKSNEIIHFAMSVPEDKKIDLGELAVEVIIIEK